MQRLVGTCRSLSGTCLSAGNDVITLGDRRQAILLNGGWDVVAGKLDILQHDRVKARILELSNRLKTDSALLDYLNGSNARTG